MYVVITENSFGNESVGEMWKETRVFQGDATLDEVMEWAQPGIVNSDKKSKKQIILTKSDTKPPHFQQNHK